MLQEAQGHGLDLDGGRAGRFEQAGMKRTQLAALAGRALGKQAHRIALAETRLHGLAHRVHRVALAALDEQRAGAGHQPADDGPAADLAFGHEGRGARRVQHEDIDPGHVIGHQQHGTGHARLAPEDDPHATGGHEEARPAAVEPGARFGSEPRIHQAHAKQAEHDPRQDEDEPKDKAQQLQAGVSQARLPPTTVARTRPGSIIPANGLRALPQGSVVESGACSASRLTRQRSAGAPGPACQPGPRARRLRRHGAQHGRRAAGHPRQRFGAARAGRAPISASAAARWPARARRAGPARKARLPAAVTAVWSEHSASTVPSASADRVAIALRSGGCRR